jgi:hypothetical protein
METLIRGLVYRIRNYNHTEEERLLVVGLLYCIATFVMVFTDDSVRTICSIFMFAILMVLVKFTYVAYIKKGKNGGDSNR